MEMSLVATTIDQNAEITRARLVGGAAAGRSLVMHSAAGNPRTEGPVGCRDMGAYRGIASSRAASHGSGMRSASAVRDRGAADRSGDTPLVEAHRRLNACRKHLVRPCPKKITPRPGPDAHARQRGLAALLPAGAHGLAADG